MSDMTHDLDVDAELSRLQQRLELGETVVGQGGDADLEGLDEEIEGLCALVRGLPLEDGRKLRPKLEILLEGVGRLQTLMRTRHDAMKDEMQDHSRRAQATRAYSHRKARGETER